MYTQQQSRGFSKPFSGQPLINNGKNVLNYSGQANQWVAVYIDDKFFLTTHSTYQKIQNLDQQIANHKIILENPQKCIGQKMQKKEQDYRQTPINQVKKRKNSLQSAKSRQCKTQINELKALKARFQIQRQLAEEEMNFHKTLQVKKRRQLKEVATFVIRNPKQKSLQNKQPKHRKGSIKNAFMMAPHELSSSNRKNQQRQSENFSQQKEVESFNLNTRTYNQKQVKQFKIINPSGEKNNQEKALDGSNTVKRSLNSQSRYQQNQVNQSLSKSKQKSFVITNRKLSSTYSKEQKQGGNGLGKDNKKKQTVNSEDQLQRLNKKLKEMQQKLILVQRKQRQLQEMQNHKQKIQQEIKSQTLKNFSSQADSKVNQNIKGMKKKVINQKNEIKKSGQHLQEKEQIKGEQKAKILVMREQKYKKLGIASSTVAYNYNQQKEKSLKQIQQINTKQKMSHEIEQLKRIIKQLRIEKIKQQTIINDLQMKNKPQDIIRVAGSYRSDNKQIVLNHEKTQNDQKTKKFHVNSNTISFSQRSLVETPNKKPEQLIHQKKEENSVDMNESNDKPLNKKDPRRILKLDINTLYKKKLSSTIITEQQNQIVPNVNNIQYQSVKQQSSGKNIPIKEQINSQIKKQQIYNKLSQKKEDNPQELQKQSISLIKKGRIMKQFFNKQKFYMSQSNNQSQRETSLKQILHSQNSDQFQNQQFKQLYDQLIYPQINIPQIQPIQTFPIPQLPSPPSLETQQGEILSQAKKICDIFQIKIKGNEHLQFKRFKNCILLKNIQNNQAIVWHFSGKFYVGGWQQKNQSGQDHKNGDGFQYVPQKHYYRGQFSHGKRNGQGTMIIANGNIYKGSWLNGQRHGKGLFFEKINNSYYDGQWKEGKKEGSAIYKVSNKEFYIGGFQSNLKTGFGLELFSNGDIYEGNYKDGKFNGKGRYFWSNGSAYVGDFVDGQRSGFGKWVSGLNDGDIYVGFYQKDKKQGKGKYIWFKGCTFEGNFLSDLKHGQGKVQYPDGRQVKGVWQYGKLKTVYKSQSQSLSRVQNEYNLFQEVQPRIRPNIPRIQETPSRPMQQSRLVRGV